MKYCDKCNVKISGNHEFCPLCQKELVEDNSKQGMLGTREVYPRIKTILESHSFTFKLLLFISIVVVVVCVMLNLIIPAKVFWSGFVTGGVVCFWISFYIAFHMKNNIAKTMLFQVTLVSILSYLWDLSTGYRGWSVDFVIPILCLSNLCVLFILSRIYVQETEDYMIYLLIGAVFGLIPFIIYLTGVLRIILPSLLCTTCSILFITAVLIFQGGSIVEELKKRLHV